MMMLQASSYRAYYDTRIYYDTRRCVADVRASIRMVHSTFASTVQTCSLGHEVHPA